MYPFDGVRLPFADDEEFFSSSAGVRFLANARELVWQELHNVSDDLDSWEAAKRTALEEQRRNAEAYKTFVQKMRESGFQQSSTILSPISGSVRVMDSAITGGLLAPVTVAEPPLSLRAQMTQNGALTTGIPFAGESDDMLIDDQKPLLGSSEELTPLPSMNEGLTAWTPQQLASQSALDGVFFEALVSQQLNLALWTHAASPEEAMRDMLSEVQLLDRHLCEEKSVLDSINAARFAEQRAHKRRRLEVESQTSKSRAKVASLKKLLGVDVAEKVATNSSAAERLRLWLHD